MKILYSLVGLVLMTLNSCSNNVSEEIDASNKIEVSCANRVFYVGNLSTKSLATPTDLTSLCSNLYNQVYPLGDNSGLKVQDISNSGALIFKFETIGNNPFYVVSEPTEYPDIYKIVVKSTVDESDFNMLVVRVEQTEDALSMVPIDADLFLTRGVVQDITDDLKARAQRWWPCFKNFFSNTDQGQVIMFIGAFGGGIGQGIATSFAGVVALGCFG